MVRKTTFFLIVIFSLAVLPVSCFIPSPSKIKSTQQRISEFLLTKSFPLEHSTTVYWDNYLIPYIDAKDDGDLFFSIGMVHAHLRLGQMELLRRVSQGRISEMAGPLTSDIDYSIRIINFRRGAVAALRGLDPETRVLLQRYVDGINYYIEHTKELPVEFEGFGFERSYWSMEDVLTIGRLASTDVNWLGWFSMLKMRKNPRWPEIWEKMKKFGGSSQPSFAKEKTAANYFGRLLTDNSRSGSNSFVISPKRSRTGSAMIASDPHLGINTPNIWILMGIKSPSFHAVGMMIPGLPFMGIGRNRNIAWGGTNMRSASSDLYNVNGEPLTDHNETIKIRWWPDETVDIRESRMGPILSDAPLLSVPDGMTLALKWVGHDSSDELTAFLKMNRAHNWKEFRDAFQSYAVSGQNFLYADDKGNIGQILALRLPLRKSPPGEDFIRDAKNPEDQWDGFIMQKDLPYAHNPDRGFLVSSNNLPVKMDPAVGYLFSANDRVRRISRLIEDSGKLGLNDLSRIQQDVFSIVGFKLKTLIIERVDRVKLTDVFQGSDPEYFKALKNWDGKYTAESKGALAYQVLLSNLVDNYYKEEYGEDFAMTVSSVEGGQEIILAEMQSMNDATFERVIRASFYDGQADFYDFKNWGDMHRLRVSHPFGMIPVIGSSEYRFEEIPAPGSISTVDKTSHRITNRRNYTSYGANARQVSILNDPDANYFVLLGGQDGWMKADNNVDQIPLWFKGKYIQLPLTMKKVRRKFPHVVRMESENEVTTANKD